LVVVVEGVAAECQRIGVAFFISVELRDRRDLERAPDGDVQTSNAQPDADDEEHRQQKVSTEGPRSNGRRGDLDRFSLDRFSLGRSTSDLTTAWHHRRP